MKTIIRTKLQILAQKMVFEKQEEKTRKIREPYLAKGKKEGVDPKNTEHMDIVIQPLYSSGVKTILSNILSSLDENEKPEIILEAISNLMTESMVMISIAKTIEERTKCLVDGFALGGIGRGLIEEDFKIPETMTMGQEIE